MNWKQLAILTKSRWEIASHTHTHPHLTELSDEDIQRELDLSIKILKKHGYEAKSFASPHGDFDQRVLNLIKARFQSHRRAWGGNEGLNEQTSLNKYDISAYELKHDATFCEIQEVIDKAKREGKWLVFLLHQVVKGEPKEYQFNSELLKKITDYISQQKIKVVTVSDYFNQ